MACQIIDNDAHRAVTAVTATTNAAYEGRIADLECRLDKQDQDIIALRSLLMSFCMKKAGQEAAKLKCEGEQLSFEQENAVQSLVSDYTLTDLKYINDCCIVGKATIGKAKYGLKVVRKSLTLSKFGQPAEVEIALDAATRALSRPNSYDVSRQHDPSVQDCPHLPSKANHETSPCILNAERCTCTPRAQENLKGHCWTPR